MLNSYSYLQTNQPIESLPLQHMYNTSIYEQGQTDFGKSIFGAQTNSMINHPGEFAPLSIDEFFTSPELGQAEYKDEYNIPPYTLPFVPNPLQQTNFFKNLYTIEDQQNTAIETNKTGIANNLSMIVNTAESLNQFKEQTQAKNAAQDTAIGNNTTAIAGNLSHIVATAETLEQFMAQSNTKNNEQDSAINNNKIAIETNLSQIVATADTLNQFMAQSNTKNDSQDSAINTNTTAINELSAAVADLQAQQPVLNETIDLTPIIDKNNEQDIQIQELNATVQEILAQEPASAQTDELTALQAQIAEMQAQIAELNQKIMLNDNKDEEQDTAISQNQEQIVDLAEITNSELWLKNNITSEEQDIVAEKGLDLLEKDQNGNPQFLIAKGRTDDQYHIYEYNKDWKGDQAQYRSIVDKYTNDDLKNGSNNLYVNKEAQVGPAGEIINKVQSNSINSEDWGYVTASGSYKTGSPLILDTNRNGTVEYQQGIGVDLNNDSRADGAAINGDKMLAMGDLNGNGVIDGSEVFGNQTVNPFTGEKLNAQNGFDALQQIAKLTQTLTGQDNIFNNNTVDIVALQAALALQNIGLGLIGDNNTTDLEDLANIATINTNYTQLPEQDGDALALQGSTFTTTDDKEQKVEDIWFKLA